MKVRDVYEIQNLTIVVQYYSDSGYFSCFSVLVCLFVFVLFL